MTIVTQEFGFGDIDFGDIAFGEGLAYGATGLQFEAVITKSTPEAVQFSGLIVDYADAQAVQYQGVIANQTDAQALEVEIHNTKSSPHGLQFSSLIVDYADAQALQYEGVIANQTDAQALQFSGLITKSLGNGLQFTGVITESDGNAVQFSSLIGETVSPQGLEFFASNMGHYCFGFGESDFGDVGFGDEICASSEGTEFQVQNNVYTAFGVQFNSLIVDSSDAQALQYQGVITESDPNGVQFSALNTQSDANGVQFSGLITKDRDNALQYEGVITKSRANAAQFSGLITKSAAQGLQFTGVITKDRDNALQYLGVITKSRAHGLEFDARKVFAAGVEFNVALYNTSQLRILWQFQSRGAESGSGTNAWGEDIATGLNWQASSQDPSPDFSVNNVNSDIVEQVYKSQLGTVTGVNLDCDVEQSPGSFLDTFAMLNHNLTTGAQIVLIGSDDPSFGTVGKTINITPRLYNVIHIEPVLPLIAFQYWRLQIDDPSNPDSFISIGTIIFGAAVIFTTSENINDRMVKRTKHFADSVKTAGFTAVKNDRSVKNSLSISFQSLQYNRGNFQNLDVIIQAVRTSLKALWIPTPHPTDSRITGRLAVFGKLSQMPEQQHNIKGTVGEDLDFISLDVEVDEAE